MMRAGTLVRGIVATFVAASLAAGAAPAQQPGMRPGPGPGPRPENRQELERRVRARFAQMMQQRLGLSSAEAEHLNATVESFMERRRRLVADEQALRRRMEAIALEEEPTDAEARTLLARMQELREQEVQLFQAEQSALMQVLTPVQLVRFHAMREQLGQRIQQLRGGQGPGPGRPPGGRGGPPGAAWPDTVWGPAPGARPEEPPGA